MTIKSHHTSFRPHNIFSYFCETQKMIYTANLQKSTTKYHKSSLLKILLSIRLTFKLLVTENNMFEISDTKSHCFSCVM